MKSPALQLLTCLLVFLSTGAAATPMNYSFDINFTSGALSGTSAQVDVTLAAVVGSGNETFFPGDGSLLAFDFELDGNAFSLPNEFNYPFGPSLGLRDGDLLSVYWVPEFGNPTATISYFPEGTPPNNQVVYVSPAGVLSEGRVDGSSWRRSSTVPVPGTAALLALGLLGIGRQRRRRAWPE